MRKLVLSALALTLLGTATAQNQNRTGWPKEITLGIIPTEGSSGTQERFAPLIAHLEKTLGVKVKSYLGADYAAVILAMQNKKIDFAYFGPKSYVEASERAGAEVLVRENAIKGGTGYKSLIIVKASSPAKKISDLKGGDFAFVEPNSTSGYLVPRSHFLLDMKVKPEDYFKRVIFAGTHENVIMGVRNGTIPAGATNDLDLARAIEGGAVKQSDLKVLWTSDTIPASVYAARKDLPATLKQAMRNAFLSFKDPKGLEVMQLRGYVPGKDSDYNSIRKLNEAAKAASK